MTYYDNSTYISNGYNREARLRAVATNAVREAVIAFGRIDRPYTDNDAAILENVYVLLQGIGEETKVERVNEHQTLSVAGSAPAPAQSQISSLLGNLDALETAIGAASEAAPVKANLPKATQKPDR